MPKGVYHSEKRNAHCRANCQRAGRLGGAAAAKVRKRQARARWSVFVAKAKDKWDVWSMAYLVGYKAGASVGERRGFARGYEQALRDTQRAAS